MISTYNYLISSDCYKPQAKYSAHKKNELKNIYKDILSISKDSPLYMFKLTSDDQSFALSIKNYAGDINSSLEQFTGTDSVFNQTILASSNEDVVRVYGHGDRDFNDMEVTVDSLAVSQVNKGKPLYTTSSILSPGTYKFGINIDGQDFDFQYKITEKSDNHTIQTQLADFINKTNIGISATIGYGDNAARSYLTLTANNTGVADGDKLYFHIYDNDTVNGRGLVDYFGLDIVDTYPANSHFSINGTNYSTASNHLELVNGATMELHGTTNTPVTIHTSTDSNSVLDAVEGLANQYNSFISFANESNIKGNGPIKVTAFMKSAIKSLGDELEACGITVSRDGLIHIDESLVKQAALDGSLKKAINSDNGLASQLRSRTEMIGLNPMEYIHKTIVTYPNVSRPGIANPYITSVYSGMLFNQYC